MFHDGRPLIFLRIAERTRAEQSRAGIDSYGEMEKGRSEWTDQGQRTVVLEESEGNEGRTDGARAMGVKDLQPDMDAGSKSLF